MTDSTHPAEVSITSIESALCAYLVETFAHEFTVETLPRDVALLEQQIIDSLDFLDTLTFIETEWNVSFEQDEQSEETLGSVHKMATTIARKLSSRTPGVSDSARRTTRQEITAHLAALGVQPGMNVVVHSSLLAFGDVEGQTMTFIEELQRAVGENGTIAVPTFTLQLTADDIFDPATTPSRTSALSEAIRMLPGARRSPCPMHSYAAIGRDADIVLDAARDTSFGPGSCLEKFLDAGFHWMFLGCGSRGEACTLTHHTEALLGVPYREWITLPRQVRFSEDTVDDVAFRYYARVKGFEARLNIIPIRDRLIQEGTMTMAEAPYGTSYMAPTAALHEKGLELLRQDPYALTLSAEAS